MWCALIKGNIDVSFDWGKLETDYAKLMCQNTMAQNTVYWIYLWIYRRELCLFKGKINIGNLSFIMSIYPLIIITNGWSLQIISCTFLNSLMAEINVLRDDIWRGEHRLHETYEISLFQSSSKQEIVVQPYTFSSPK